MNTASHLIDPETGLTIHHGLEGQDDHIDTLSNLFELIHPYSAEILSSGVQDVVSFVFDPDTVFFGVLSIAKVRTSQSYPSKSKRGYHDATDQISSKWNVQEWRDNVDELPTTTPTGVTRDPEDHWSFTSFGTPTRTSPTVLPTPLGAPIPTPIMEESDHGSPSFRTGTQSTSESAGPAAIFADSGHEGVGKAKRYHDVSEDELDAILDRVSSLDPDQRRRASMEIPYISAEEERAYIGHQRDSKGEDAHDAESDDTEYYIPEVADSTAPVGFVYLAVNSQRAPGNNHMAELSIGIVLSPSHRKKGHAQRAVHYLLQYAFDDLKVHRLQAVLVDKESPHRDATMMLLTQERFTYEGARRLAMCSPIDQTWKDVEYLSILDTEFLMRQFFRPAPKSLWEELLARHQREREELLRWEDKHVGTKAATKLRRVSSTGTLVGAPSQSDESMRQSRHGSSASSPPPSPTQSHRSEWDMMTDDDPFSSSRASSSASRIDSSEGMYISSSDSWSIAGSSDLED